MAVPTRPVVPVAPRSSEPSTFQARADRVIAFLTTLVDYIAESNGFTQEQAEVTLSAAIINNIPAATLSSIAGDLLAVNAAGNAIEGVSPVTQRAIATEAQATAGTASSVEMSPLRVNDVIETLEVQTLGYAVVKRT